MFGLIYIINTNTFRLWVALQAYLDFDQVCERTAADKKGGHLARRNTDGKFMLRESAMCPDEDKAAFEDISKHK